MLVLAASTRALAATTLALAAVILARRPVMAVLVGAKFGAVTIVVASPNTMVSATKLPFARTKLPFGSESPPAPMIKVFAVSVLVTETVVNVPVLLPAMFTLDNVPPATVILLTLAKLLIAVSV